MLIRYKKNLEKIAMGLLSFMPEEKKMSRNYSKPLRNMRPMITGIFICGKKKMYWEPLV